MKILSVVGARPQFVKLAPVAKSAARSGVEHFVVHTGQHYDENMSQTFFDALRIPTPHVNLNVGSAGHGRQTGQMLIELEPVLMSEKPDWVLVYGDTNSTLAAAVCAIKLHIPVAHLEAGLRSFSRRMPEEHNRILTDHSADLCLAPTQVAMEHLRREGLAERSILVGDVMTDVLLETAREINAKPVDSAVPIAQEYCLATIHRPSNTDNAERLDAIIEALASFPHTVYLAAHPRLVAKAAEHGLELARGSVTVVPPLGYPQLVQAVIGAGAVITDSGGLQKEAYLLGKPVTTVRGETEWVETLTGGWNELVDDPTKILQSVNRPFPSGSRGTPYGTGNAADNVISTLVKSAILRSELK